jgi:hypothetical protein
MIRKLVSGEYRLYSRKKDPKTVLQAASLAREASLPTPATLYPSKHRNVTPTLRGQPSLLCGFLLHPLS